MTRLAAPPFDVGAILLEPPPAVPAKVAVSAVARLMPVAMLVAAAGMILLYLRSGTGVARSPMFLFFPVMMLLSALGSAAYGARDNRRSSDVEEGRRDYLRYLGALDATTSRTAVAQHRSLAWTHPDPRALWSIVGGRRMWERLPGDADFCHARVGLTSSDLATPLVEPEVSASGHRDHVATEWLRRLVAHRSTVADVPSTVDLTTQRRITLGGDVAAARALARAIICQLAVLHGPGHVKVMAAVDANTQLHWEWLKWLPHHQHPHVADALGTARMTYLRLDDADLPADGAHVVVLVDGGDVTSVDPLAGGRTIVQIGDVDPAVGADALRIDATDGRLDALTPAQAVVCARRLAASLGQPTRSRASAATGMAGRG